MAARNRVEFDLQDEAGNLYDAGVQVLWTSEVGAVRPQLYEDYANATALGNPFNVPPGTSHIAFYSPAGRYRLDVFFNGAWVNLKRDFPVGTARELDAETLLSGSRIFANLYRPDVVVNLLIDRDAYDDELAGFGVLVVEDEAIYYKLTDTSADWSDPVPITVSLEGEFGTIADVEAVTVPLTQDSLFIAGRTAEGDGGAALYKRVGSEPAHAGKIQDAGGAWWEIAEAAPNSKQFASVANGVDALTDQSGGGTLRIPAGEDPALPASFPDVMMEYDGPRISMSSGFTFPVNHTADKLFRAYHDGPHALTRYAVGIELEAEGAGINGPVQIDAGLGLGVWKANWTGTRSALATGELNGQVTYIRASAKQDSSAETHSDFFGSLYNIEYRGDCGSAGVLEAHVGQLTDAFEYRKVSHFHFGSMNWGTVQDYAIGFITDAVVGSLNEALLVRNSGGTWSSVLKAIDGSNVIQVDLKSNGSLWLGQATGGQPGAGEINAKAVRDDNSVLTCQALAREFLETGAVDLAKWDGLVPDHVIPARKVKVPRDEKKRTGLDFEVHFDKDGNGVAATPLPIHDEVDAPEDVVPRIHETAHLFKKMLDEGFDPRDPAQYIAKLKRDEALPGMPTQKDWKHGALSLGQLHSRLWLATEMLALVVIKQQERMDALEARLDAGGL